MANSKANALALPFAKANGKWRIKDECGVFADFNAKAKWQKCQYNDALHSPKANAAALPFR